MSEPLINEEHFSLGSYCYLSHENLVSLQFVTAYKQLNLVFMNTSVPNILSILRCRHEAKRGKIDSAGQS